jgi:WD40 repeat protein
VPYTQPTKTPGGVPVAGLAWEPEKSTGGELCFVSAARLAARAPVAVGASFGQPVRVFDAETGSVLAEYAIPAGEQDVISLDIDDEGERIAMLDLGYRVWLWDWRQGSEPKLMGALPLWEPAQDRSLALETIRFGPGSTRIVVGQPHSGALLLNRDGLIVQRIGTGIDLSGDAPPRELPGFVVDVAKTSWSADGSRVLFLVDDRPRLLDATAGEELPLPLDESKSYVTNLALSPDGAWLATSKGENEVIMTRIGDGEIPWGRTFFFAQPDTHTPSQRPLTEEELRKSVNGLAFHADGKSLAVALEGRWRLAILDAASGKVIGFSGTEPSSQSLRCRLEHAGRAGFLMTPLPGGFVSRVRMTDGDSQVLHDMEALSTPPDAGWGDRVFFAGENSYHLVDPTTWATLWSSPIQDW